MNDEFGNAISNHFLPHGFCSNAFQGAKLDPGSKPRLAVSILGIAFRRAHAQPTLPKSQQHRGRFENLQAFGFQWQQNVGRRS